MCAQTTWKGFLPDRTLVMARPIGTTATTAATEARLIFVGEYPASDLLKKMISAMGLDLSQVHICDCLPENIPSSQVQVIVTLGQAATQALLKTETPLSDLRGRFHPFQGKQQSPQIMPTFHPADLLRHPESKREAWSDLQAVARELGLTLPSPRLPSRTSQKG
ncbi:uracil-DNA glycosylase family protein [Bdellovibrionota bacterium FG-1]